MLIAAVPVFFDEAAGEFPVRADPGVEFLNPVADPGREPKQGPDAEPGNEAEPPSRFIPEDEPGIDPNPYSFVREAETSLFDFIATAGLE